MAPFNNGEEKGSVSAVPESRHLRQNLGSRIRRVHTCSFYTLEEEIINSSATALPRGLGAGPTGSIWEESKWNIHAEDRGRLKLCPKLHGGKKTATSSLPSFLCGLTLPFWHFMLSRKLSLPSPSCLAVFWRKKSTDGSPYPSQKRRGTFVRDKPSFWIWIIDGVCFFCCRWENNGGN